jgi:hypothetical protein
MTSLLSSFLYQSASKIESFSRRSSTEEQQRSPPELIYKSKSSPTSNTSGGPFYYQPYNSAEPVPTASFLPPPPYDTMQIRNGNSTPTPTPSTSWTTEMSALAEKIRDDVTNSLKNNKQQANIDRHSISQGMKLVSIAADEYEGGNESTALEIYLTGIDKIIMALPSKLFLFIYTLNLGLINFDR